MESRRWTSGVNAQGGGAYVKSPDGKVYFRLYGYAQPQATWTDRGNNQAFGSADFRVRRARIDFSVDYDDRFKLFLEYDGSPADGTSLVEAWTQASFVKGRHFIRFGKYITPFSTENLRSSRALETVERYIALNAMFGLPGLDVQFGPMLWGHVDSGKKLTYYAGVWNGNASAGAAASGGQRGNSRDNNIEKEIQARLDYQAAKFLRVGVALDVDEEEPQLLAIPSYSGARFVSVAVDGKRRGVNVDAHWKHGSISVDSEWLRMEFEDTDVELHGGYGQIACWVKGTEAKGGSQAVLRAEYAELEGAAVASIDGDTIVAVTGGANVWFNGWTRLQVNLIGERTNGRGNGALTEGSTWRPTLLSQFQVKF